MATVISFNKIKELKERSQQTQLLDLGKYIDPALEGIILPFKVKSYEETLDLKERVQLDVGKLSIEYKLFRHMPKGFRDMYLKSEKYNKGVTEKTYFQLCKVDKDKGKLERYKFRERLFNVLIHLDMETKTEEGKTLWEDIGLSEGDYNGLITFFSDIITFEQHLDILDILIDKLKSGVTEEPLLQIFVTQYKIREAINSIEDEDEKKAFIENWQNTIEQAQKEAEEENSENKEEEEKPKKKVKKEKMKESEDTPTSNNE